LGDFHSLRLSSLTNEGSPASAHPATWERALGTRSIEVRFQAFTISFMPHGLYLVHVIENGEKGEIGSIGHQGEGKLVFRFRRIFSTRLSDPVGPFS
jgi:hypothetical protein